MSWVGQAFSNRRHRSSIGFGTTAVAWRTQIEAGQFKLNLAEYALGGIVETVMVATESLAATKKLAFKTEVAKGLPHGLGDEQRLTQVLLNLVGKAITFKYTGADSTSGTPAQRLS